MTAGYINLGAGLFALERPGPGGTTERCFVHRWRERDGFREIGLGSAPGVDEAEARARVRFVRDEVARGRVGRLPLLVSAKIETA